ncbi:DUF3599 family protein [Parageobacillus thermoglucosidasius]|uniref:Phage portal protein n=1 Tax=Parageobacillus thermoglucosidasius TaxID=1426 RepID=A0A1B7KP87_PARTM|nr:DUF3599 family protein [Parageobacillus thermoglucosidasius]OAT71882.1 phage portal protein [Parageobacillus thermoglucosidasius]
MSYRNLLIHRCDVYHLTASNEDSDSNFGIPIKDFQPEYKYPDSPDLVDVPCYFTEKNQTIVQGEPNQIITQSFLVHFLPSADIRVNDKVVWNGIEFKLQIPKKIRNHHIEVTAVRSENL